MITWSKGYKQEVLEKHPDAYCVRFQQIWYVRLNKNTKVDFASGRSAKHAWRRAYDKICLKEVYKNVR